MIKKFLQYHPVHKKIVPIFDVIFLLHPTMFFAVWVMVVVGMISADINMQHNPLWSTEFSWEIFFVFLGLTLLISSSFISNQLADEKNIHYNHKLYLIGQYVSAEKGKSIAKILLISGIIISITANWITAIPTIFIYIIWGNKYNKVPFEWMNDPIVIWLVNSCLGIFLFLIGWLLVMTNNSHNGYIPLSIDTFYNMFPYILCFSAVSLLVVVPNVKNNNAAGARTFSIYFSSAAPLIISLMMVSVALYVSIKQANPLASTTTMVSLPFFIFAAVRGLNKDILRAIRYPIFILNFFTVAYYPWLVLPIICTYYLSKYYYWHRFEWHYPTFLVDND